MWDIVKRIQDKQTNEKIFLKGEEDNPDFVDEDHKSLEVKIASNVFKNRVVS